MDAAGRPLKDDRGQRLIYQTAAPASALLAPSTLAASSSSTTQESVTSTSIKKTNARMQKTGVSPSYDVVWRTSAFGSGIGATGIWPMDTDADGDLEFVLGGGAGFGGNAYWSIVEYDAQAQSYNIAWQSSPYYTPNSGWSPTVSALRAIEIGSTRRIWVGRSDGRIDVYNALTREIVQTLNVSASPIVDFAIADADNDGDVDVVALTATNLHMFNPITLAPSRTIAQGGNRLAVGNVDDDDEVEVVLNTGLVLEINGATPTTEWQSPTIFGAYVALSDFDGDGRQELVAAESWYQIRAWDLEARSVKWSYATQLDIGAMRLIDVTGDGVAEVVYGDNQWGAIHVLDAVSRTELWSIGNPEHGTTDVAVFDADDDGQLEIMWGAGYSSTGPDYLFVHDVGTRAREWVSQDYLGPYTAVDMGDIDADGELEIVVASRESQSGYSDGLIMVYDAQTYALEWRSSPNTFGNNALTGVHALKLVNVDTDPQLEIVVGTDRLYNGALYVVDGLTRQIQNDAVYDSGSPLSVMDAADLTGDGMSEIIAGNQVAHTGSPGVFVYVLDPRTDAVVWQSAALATGFSQVSDIEVVDAGAVGTDILAVSSAVNLIRWSDRRHLISASATYRSATVGDVHAATGNEILATTYSGTIDVLNGETLALITSYPVCGSEISAISMHATNRVIVTCNDALLVYDLPTQSVIDSTPAPSPPIGTNGSLVRKVDGQRSLILTGGNEAALFVDLSANAIPTVSAASASVHWRGFVDLQLSGSDADGDALRFELASLPTLGTATWLNAAGGRLRYSGAGTAVGSDSLQVRVSDGAQYSAPQTISLTLTNTAPKAPTTQISLHWRGEQQVALAGSDADSDPLSFSMTGAPTRGAASLNTSTGVLTFTPNSNFVGADALTYRVTDGPASETSEVQIALTNAAPVATNAQYDITRGININGRFRGTDADNDPLTFAIVNAPMSGTITFEANTGLFEYVPSTSATGTDSVTFKVSDGVSESQATLTFSYPAASAPGTGGGRTSGGGGGGGGNVGGLLLLLLLPLIRRTTRAS